MSVSASVCRPPAQRTAFEQLFIRPHTRTPGAAALDNAGGYRDPAGAAAPSGLCRRPHEGAVLAGAGKVFDYQGVFVAPTSCVNYRKAEVLIARCRLAAIMPPAFAFAKQIIRLLLGRL